MMLKICFDLVCHHILWRGKIRKIRSIIKDILQIVSGDGILEMPAFITFVLSDDIEIQDLNKKWRKKDYPTNVLSFPSDDRTAKAERYLGDVIISYTTLEKESKMNGVDFYHHCAHMLLHGFLHLCGYDHQNENDAKIMEDLESRILHKLNIASPYL